VSATATAPFKKKTRVRVTSDLPGVPEGTVGVVRDTVGFALPRHRVLFDNGHLALSVARDKLVRDDEWDQFLADREAADAKAEAEAEAEAEANAAAPADADAPAEGATPADDRLAALLARSKAARERKG